MPRRGAVPVPRRGAVRVPRRGAVRVPRRGAVRVAAHSRQTPDEVWCGALALRVGPRVHLQVALRNQHQCRR